MIVTNTATPFSGRTICGETPVPADRDSAHAVYVRHGRACGISFESGSMQPFIRCHPGYQVPSFARNANAFRRFIWECEDDRVMGVRLDERDGEVIYTCHVLINDANIEETVEDALEFILGDPFHESLVAYVESFII